MPKDSKQQDTSTDEALLEFKVGPFRFCASALEVEAIISPPEMIQVPLSTNIVAGCFVHQKRTVTVLSMHNKLGLPFTQNENETHIILATVDSGLKGFWVDQAMDVTQLDSFESIADYYPHERKAYASFLTREDDILLQTSFQRLYNCARSRLYWSACLEANKTAVAVEDNVATLATIEAIGKAGEDTNKHTDSANVSSQQPIANENITTTRHETGSNAIAAHHAANNGFSSSHGSTNTVADDAEHQTEQQSHSLVANADYSANSHSTIKHQSDSNGGNNNGKTTDRQKGISNKLAPTRTAAKSAAPAGTAYAGGYSALASRPAYGKLAGKTGANRNPDINAPVTPGSTTETTHDPSTHDRNQSAASQAYTPSRPLHETPESSGLHGNYQNATDDAAPARQWESQPYAAGATTETEEEEKKRNLLPLAAALLALSAIGLGSMYLLDDDTGPVIKNPGKLASTRDSDSYTKPLNAAAVTTDSEKNNPGTTDTAMLTTDTLTTNKEPEHSMDTANLIEPTAPVDTVTEKDTLNELVQAETPAPSPSTSARVIEVQVEEQPDTVLSAITSPEPVTHQQFSVLGSQEFTHVVKKGDTLWHITKRHLGNPFRYPELAASSHISNPHLIYPGDVIKITVTRNRD
ncbi:MAG: chemotaxis protein CheW [Proteobacteria bacterium]|nr:chemotaxis protein CheW [Pseudomonadota bacterium]